MSGLYITVGAYAGSECRKLCGDMIALANRLGISVHGKLNDVTVIAKPGADPEDLGDLWDEAMRSKRPYKIACAHPRETSSGRGESE